MPWRHSGGLIERRQSATDGSRPARARGAARSWFTSFAAASRPFAGPDQPTAPCCSPMAAESGVERARRFHALAQEHQQKADMYRAKAAACEKGVVGEAEVARLLDVLDGAGWHVLNDRYKAAGSLVNIDHIVVGPPGVLVVDAKNWSGGPVHLDEQGMAHRGRRRDKELASLQEAVGAVAGHVRVAHDGAVTAGALAFVGDGWTGDPVLHKGLVVMRADSLQRWLTNLPGTLTPQQVNLIGSTLDAALPPRSGPARPLTLAAFSQRRSPAKSASARPRGRPSQRRSRPRVSLLAELRQLALRAALALFLFLVVLPIALKSISSSVDRQLQPVQVNSPAPPVVQPEPTPTP